MYSDNCKARLCVGKLTEWPSMPDVVSMGEVMIEFNAMTRGPLRSVVLFEKHAAGAEGNVAIGVSRLG